MKLNDISPLFNFLHYIVKDLFFLKSKTNTKPAEPNNTEHVISMLTFSLLATSLIFSIIWVLNDLAYDSLDCVIADQIRPIYFYFSGLYLAFIFGLCYLTTMIFSKLIFDAPENLNIVSVFFIGFRFQYYVQFFVIMIFIGMLNESADMLDPKAIQRWIMWAGSLGVIFVISQLFRRIRQELVKRSKKVMILVFVCSLLLYSFIIGFYMPIKANDMFDESKFDKQCLDIK